ncbi:hypothetical protein HWV62_19147 [Athelia sp. TMB]|nr:hypothetical protein HWV62_19147 [Athelia sp. TMB]
MSRSLLSWVAPLTAIVTVAIYLHLRGFPGVGTASTPVPPPDEAQTPADELNLEVLSADKMVPHPGEKVFHSAETFTHLDVASTDQTVKQTVPAQPETRQRPDTATQSSTAPYRDDLAKVNALKAQSAAFSDHGQREEALTAITEAANLLRTLASNYPAALNSELALSLRILSSCLVVVGQKAEALSAIEEAVVLQRALVNEHPLEFNAELASSLNHHSNRLSKLNRHEEALLAIQESVGLYRVTAEAQPEAPHPGLAASLYNLSTRLSKCNLREEALAAILEACSLYQALAAEQPSLYSNNLVASRKKLSACQAGPAGRAEAASAGQVTSTKGHSVSESSGFRPRQIGATGSIFNNFGNHEVINVVGNYVTAEEAVAKISRILQYAEGASWDPDRACLPGTRLSILSILDTWARGAGSERICLLEGVAGCGKTAVSHTIAEKLHAAGLLACAFFFSRNTASRSSPKNLFATLVRGLANRHPRVAEAIAEALDADPALASASLSRQFDALILGPARYLPADRTAVFVIDALDESIANELDTQLLAILRDKAAQLPPQVRILLTSRPTRVIEAYLSRCSHIVAHSIDVHSVENKGDIDMYVDTQLRDEAILHKMGLTSPDETVIRNLKHLAEGLFIWIVTVCNFLHTAHRPKEKLQALLSKSSQRGSEPEKKMDELYAAILTECGDWEDADFVKDYELVMGTIMALKRPLSLAALRALHDGSLDLETEQLLQRFGSVLTGFHDAHQPIRILHLSFHEFVTDHAAHNDSTQRFYLSERRHSSRLAELCVKTLNRELAKPIAGTGYLARHEDDAPGIPEISGASEQLVYGCAHWPSHLQDVETPQTIQAHVIALISRHLVTWTEVVAATDVFRGSLQIEQWIQLHVPGLEHYIQSKSQADALSKLGNRLGYAVRMEESQVATQEAVILFRALAVERPAAHNADLARCLANLSMRLSNLGQAHDGLLAVEEAVHLYRALVAERPAAYSAPLATSLDNLSARLSALGRAQEALSAAEEAVNMYRDLAAERPGAYNDDLAGSLSNLSVHLSALGRAQEALSVVEEAVNLRRALAAKQPAAYNADLADCLNNFSNGLAALGRAQEALSAVEEAVNLRRALVAERPAAYNADLADSLNGLSNRLSAFGRAQEALSAAVEVVHLYRALAAERPAAYNVDLAASLNNLSVRLSAFGRAREALSAVEESVDLKRALAAERPAAYNADLAMSLSNLSAHLANLGRAQEALLAGEEAVNMYRVLVTERPATYNADLAMSLSNFSTHLSSLGRAPEALSADEEAVNLYRALAAERPAAYNAHLAGSLNNVSGELFGLGQRREGLSAAQEAVRLLRVPYL